MQLGETRATQRSRITCEEEERVTKGYDISTYFTLDDLTQIGSTGLVKAGGEILLRLRYLPTARLVWVNRKWRIAREDKNGFAIDVKTGAFVSDRRRAELTDKGESTDHIRDVMFYTTNIADALYVEPVPALGLDENGVLTLQFALKRAMERVFQVEPAELGVTAIGDPEHPNILYYEAAEGTLGILSQLAEQTGPWRRVVEEAIKVCQFAQNESLQTAIANNSLTTRELHHGLLRLIYRLLLMMVAEERGLLFAEAATPRQRKLYADHYSIARLRRLAERRALVEPTTHDLWRGLRSTFRLFETDGPGAPLGLTGLGGQLFAASALGPLQSAELDNGTLLSVLAKLSMFRQPDTGQLSRVNYGALATEEFGSVYERLLELHPVINPAVGNLPPTFGFKQAAGNERKTTGSYYTPSSLVECLLDSALDPVLEDRLKNFAKLGYKSADEAVLALKVCDPACGSGHFLIAAAQRIARRLALLRSKGDEPSVSELRHTLREVISHCIYGVDINPMSVELCKVALWLEAMEAGKPLSFLDHHIRCGNSLLGATPELIAKGIPDDAFTAIEGDDKKACAALKKLNARERAGFGELFALEDRATFDRLQQAAVVVENLPDDSVRAVEQKSAAFEQLQHN